MIVAIAQLNYHIGNFKENTARIIHSIDEAKRKGADLIVFAELAIGGYVAKDLFRYPNYIENCEGSIRKIAAHCIDIACIIGAPIRNMESGAKALHNAALFLCNGKIEHIVHKTLLPDYDIFDEYRYFEPNRVFQCFHYKGTKIALTICEDLWNVMMPHLYHKDPMAALAKEQPDIMINIAASPFSETHYETRLSVVEAQSKSYQLPALYVNNIGAHADIIFDGRSLVFNHYGKRIDTLKPFEEDQRYYRVNRKDIVPLHEVIPYSEPDSIAVIHDALVLGIRDFFRKSGFKKAVLGLSGGIDSAVVAALAAEALGGENVISVLLPSAYSTDHSIKDALDLIEQIGSPYEKIPIKEATDAFDRMLASSFENKEVDITEENIQARIRAIVLMALSNKHGYILLNTSNKSEAAVGYGTLYGDMAGALGVIGDVFKTRVYELARYINRERIIIPENTIAKAPSAELRPDQKDSDSLPEYEILDEVLYQYIEQEKSPQQIVESGFESELVYQICTLVDRAEFKRFQSPPILRVTQKAFGVGRVMPLVAIGPASSDKAT